MRVGSSGWLSFLPQTSSYVPLPTNEVQHMEDYQKTKELEAGLGDADVHVHVTEKEVDTAAQVAFDIGELDPAEAERVRKKIDRHILPLMMILYWCASQFNFLRRLLDGLTSRNDQGSIHGA